VKILSRLPQVSIHQLGGRISDLVNKRDSLERQLENCRNTDPSLTKELDNIEKEIDDFINNLTEGE
jgi:chromosome segregation ATPase